MQLAKADINEIVRPSYFLNVGKELANYIDRPHADDYAFSMRLRDCKKFFPKLIAAVGESKKPLRKQSIEERTHLKEKLLEDIRTSSAAAKAELDGEKRLGSEEFPSDPDECLRFLDSKEDSLHEQMERIQSTLRELNYVRTVLELVQKSKRELADFDESLYTSTPSEAESLPSKKPKRL